MADVTEQAARLNTLMRFHQYADALPFAYKYRMDLQLAFPKGPQIEKALKAVEEIIDSLERVESRVKKLGKILWSRLVADKSLVQEENPAPALLIASDGESTPDSERQ